MANIQHDLILLSGPILHGKSLSFDFELPATVKVDGADYSVRFLQSMIDFQEDGRYVECDFDGFGKVVVRLGSCWDESTYKEIALEYAKRAVTDIESWEIEL